MEHFPLRTLFVAAVAATALTASTARADIVVTTYPDWNGSSNVQSFGPQATPTYGETFTNSPNYAALTSFTFWVPTKNTSPIDFRAYVYAWTGSGITGPALFTSASLAMPGNPPSSGYQMVTVPTPGVSLAAGGQYVAFFSTLGESNALNASGRFGLTNLNPGDSKTLGGQFVYNNGQDFANLSSNTWNPGGPIGVPAFELTFAVPEPSPLALGALASVAFAAPVAFRRWRARKVA